MRKSWGLVAALSGAALALPGVAMAAEEPVQTPAGESQADAVAAEVDGIVSAGETHARSGQDSGSAEGNALTLGGEPPSEQFGGKVEGLEKEASGSLLDTDDTPLGRLQVTPWSASTKGKDGCRASSAKAAVARLTVIDQKTLHVNVLQSQSDTDHCGMKSTGKSSSDGATVDLGGGALLLTLLHSEAESGKEGKTYLVSINGNEIGSNEQFGENSVIEIPGLLTLGLAQAGGSEGTVFADVADLTLGDGQLTAKIVGASGAPAAGAPAVQSGGEDNAGAPAADDSNAGAGALATTGAEIGGVTLLGAAMVLFGEALRRRGRRRATATA